MREVAAAGAGVPPREVGGRRQPAAGGGRRPGQDGRERGVGVGQVQSQVGERIAGVPGHVLGEESLQRGNVQIVQCGPGMLGGAVSANVRRAVYRHAGQ